MCPALVLTDLLRMQIYSRGIHPYFWCFIGPTPMFRTLNSMVNAYQRYVNSLYPPIQRLEPVTPYFRAVPSVISHPVAATSNYFPAVLPELSPSYYYNSYWISSNDDSYDGPTIIMDMEVDSDAYYIVPDPNHLAREDPFLFYLDLNAQLKRLSLCPWLYRSLEALTYPLLVFLPTSK